MRWLLTVQLILLMCGSVSAQTSDSMEVPPGRALIAVVVGAADDNSAVEVSDDAGFRDLVEAKNDRPAIKAYSVDPGTYSIVTAGAAEAENVNLDAGEIYVVKTGSGLEQLFGKNLESGFATMQATTDFEWQGQEEIQPDQHKIFFSPKPGNGTDDPGPMQPKMQEK